MGNTLSEGGLSYYIVGKFSVIIMWNFKIGKKEKFSGTIKVNSKKFPVNTLSDALQVFEILFPEEEQGYKSMYRRVMNKYTKNTDLKQKKLVNMRTIKEVAKEISLRGKKVSIFVSEGVIEVPKGFSLKVSGKIYIVNNKQDAKVAFMIHTGFPSNESPTKVNDVISYLKLLGNKIEIRWEHDNINYQVSV